MSGKFNKLIVVVISGVLLAGVLAGCGGNKPAQNNTVTGSGDQGGEGFREYPIGDEQQVENMQIAAVYFQPVPMVPESRAGLKPEEADIHLEADIAALPNNPLGFGAGEWIPHLTVNYRLEHTETKKVIEGTFMPMNAGDGPHYGANVKMMGAGNYKLSFTIKAPQDFLLHTDNESGVPGRWWNQPVEVQWDFPFMPRKW